jgi:hypothetical protein
VERKGRKKDYLLGRAIGLDAGSFGELANNPRSFGELANNPRSFGELANVAGRIKATNKNRLASLYDQPRRAVPGRGI